MRRATGTAGRWRSRTRRAPARATVYRPDIGGLLPVYVADRYEGIEARPFHELSDDEVEALPGRQRRRRARGRARARPDVALANHLVMGPAILARALATTSRTRSRSTAARWSTPSSRYPRFRPFAVEGLAGARGVLVGSRHTAESLWAEMDDPSLPGRTRLGPPGVDVERFAPREPGAARAGLARSAPRSRRAARRPRPPSRGSSLRAATRARRVAALASVGPDGDRLVVFVGKLIASKGVELLLAALPLVLAREPRARL